MTKKILLADDSITIQKVIGITFANEDYELTVVDNGVDAVAKAGEISPDLVLADVIMPEKDGYEVCKEIKAIPALAGVPVILLTGTFEPFDEARSLEVGADDFITKPFESQTLIDKVKEQLAKISVAPAAATPPAPTPAVPGAAAPAIKTATAAAAPAAPAADDEIVFDLGEDEVVAAPAAETPEEDMWAEDDFGDESPASFDEVEETAAVEETPSDEDIWGDMDLGDETEVESDLELDTVTEDSASTAVEEFDEFEFEDEIPGVEDFMKEPDAAAPQVPVEEESIEFEDELIETPPVEAASFDTEPAIETSLPVSPPEPTPAPPFEPEVVSMASPTPPHEPALAARPDASQGLSEDQLRNLLTQASREMIEKVIWEVVPELAETLIKEEIKKLKASGD
ncbi:MAG: response regulator [bacterium]|nr:response regulator [bacterium]